MNTINSIFSFVLFSFESLRIRVLHNSSKSDRLVGLSQDPRGYDFLPKITHFRSFLCPCFPYCLVLRTIPLFSSGVCWSSFPVQSNVSLSRFPTWSSKETLHCKLYNDASLHNVNLQWGNHHRPRPNLRSSLHSCTVSRTRCSMLNRLNYTTRHVLFAQSIVHVTRQRRLLIILHRPSEMTHPNALLSHCEIDEKPILRATKQEIIYTYKKLLSHSSTHRIHRETRRSGKDEWNIPKVCTLHVIIILIPNVEHPLKSDWPFI